jgi:hypothetical protein
MFLFFGAKAPSVHKGQFDPRVLLEAFMALHEIGV